MPVSQSPTLSSIDLSGLPVEVAEAVAQVVDFCRNQARSDPSAEMFETVETGLREAMNGLGCKLLGAWAESRDDGASRIERDGQSWFRVAATPKTIMTTLGPVVFRRARYRNGASSTSLVPVDESLGLIDDYLTRPAAQLGLMMMGHCTPREAEEFFAKMGGMTPSVSTLQRLTQSMHERWESIAPETLASIRAAEDIPADAVSASVSLDGVMVALRAGEGGCAEACWREASCGTVSFHDAKGKRMKTLYLGRMPESGKVRLKAQLASEVAPYPACATGDQDRRRGRRRRRQLDLPREPLARDRGHRLLARLRASPRGLGPCGGAPLVREAPRDPAPRPPRRRQGDPGVVLPPATVRRGIAPRSSASWPTSESTAIACVTTP